MLGVLQLFLSKLNIMIFCVNWILSPRIHQRTEFTRGWLDNKTMSKSQADQNSSLNYASC